MALIQRARQQQARHCISVDYLGSSSFLVPSHHRIIYDDVINSNSSTHNHACMQVVLLPTAYGTLTGVCSVLAALVSVDSVRYTFAHVHLSACSVCGHACALASHKWRLQRGCSHHRVNVAEVGVPPGAWTYRSMAKASPTNPTTRFGVAVAWKPAYCAQLRLGQA